MLMHSCYCIFISVTGGFVQMLKDSKNLLKMSLKILFIKRKRKFSSIPSLPQFRPTGLSFRQPSSAYRWRTVPAQPRQPSNPASRSAQPSRRSRPSSHAPRRRQPSSRSPATPTPAPGNRPRPAADARAPPVGAAPNLPRPAPAPGQGGTAVQRPGVVGAPPLVPLGLVKRQPSPPRAPPAAPAPFSPHSRPQLLHGGAPRIAVRRPRRRRPRAVSTSILPRCELHRGPLSLPMRFISRFVAFSAQSASAVNSMPPAMAPAPRLSPPAVFSTRARPPFFPRALGCPRFPVWRTLAPYPSSPACSLPPAMASLAGVPVPAGLPSPSRF